MAGMFSKASNAVSNAFSAEEKVKKGDEEGASLTTVLSTAEDRSALTILVADATELMRQGITDVFDANQTGKPEDMFANLGDNALPKDDDGNVIEKPQEEDTKTEKDVVKEQEAQEKLQEKMSKELEARKKELSGPKMQELKNAALHHFDNWRESVILRVGEIVNSKETAHEQKEHAHPKQQKPEPSKGSTRQSEHPKYDPGIDEMYKQTYPPIDNPLREFAQEKRALILHSMLLLLLSLEHYQSYSRTLMLHLTTSLDLSVAFLAEDESKIARGLLAAAENMNADDETKKKAEENQSARKWKVGFATVAGAALIGVTGGLAAPLLAAGVGSVMGGLGLASTAAAGYLGTLAGSSVIVGGLFGAYGGRMTGQMMDQYAREVEDFAFVPVREQHKPRKIEKEYRRLRVAIGISGWLTKTDEVTEPWKVIDIGMESFALRWELEALMNLGNSITTMVKSAAWGYAKSEIIKHTVVASLTAGLWPLALLKVSRIIDNPWSVANYRATKAGEVLADALINKAQGERPVTLVGYSLGAKVIFTCLQRLAERKAFGLVESAILIGAPTPSTAADWRMIRSVVSGRVVNVFSVKDYILAFLYRSSSIQLGVAGLQPVENVKGVENVDVSDMVTGHTAYRLLTGTILRKIGFEDIDDKELQKEQEELEEEEAKDKQAQQQKQEEKQEGAVDAAPTSEMAKMKLDKGEDLTDDEVKALEQEVQKKNEQSYIGWMQEKGKGFGLSTKESYQNAKAKWQARQHEKDNQDPSSSKDWGGMVGGAATSLANPL
ncbi:hypothetical protein D0868_14464 [Hortaea werneckii]|uniref:DUF726-domain-containing protein n=1 Tax=Hortaea werneckii TaxID=91943 RepID=A0A3M6XIJ8_HORWE|nr:hypothetical protein D0868_14464 [Hortaea werneckii]